MARRSTSVSASTCRASCQQPRLRNGAIPEEKLAETADCVAGFVRQARGRGVDRLEVLVTSPGRQAENGSELRRSPSTW